jgi:hypothetical protein
MEGSMKRDTGASLVLMLVTVLVVVYVLLVGVRVAPSVMEYWAVQKLVTKVARMGTDEQARQAFDAEARMMGIQNMRGDDLDIQFGGNGLLRVSFAYEREFALFGPAHLVMRYRGQSH